MKRPRPAGADAVGRVAGVAEAASVCAGSGRFCRAWSTAIATAERPRGWVGVAIDIATFAARDKRSVKCRRMRPILARLDKAPLLWTYSVTETHKKLLHPKGSTVNPVARGEDKTRERRFGVASTRATRIVRRNLERKTDGGLRGSYRPQRRSPEPRRERQSRHPCVGSDGGAHRREPASARVPAPCARAA